MDLPSVSCQWQWQLHCLTNFKRELIYDIADSLTAFDQRRRSAVVKYLEKTFIRWIFRANADGELDDLIPHRSIVSPEEVAHCSKRFKLHVSHYPQRRYWNLLRTLHAAAPASNFPYTIYTLRRCKGDFYTVNDKQLLAARQVERLRMLFRGGAVDIAKNNDSTSDNQDHTTNNDKNDEEEEHSEFVTHVGMLIERYRFLGSLHMHLAFPPSLLPPNTVELFGSPLNTAFRHYCSPFACEVEWWGSSGSFFQLDLVEWVQTHPEATVFTANPPFDDYIMTRMSERLVEQLARCTAANLAVTIVSTLPVWDSDTQRDLSVRDYGLGFPALELLQQKCPQFKEQRVVTRSECKYYDYFYGEHVPVANTHVLLLSTSDTPPIKLDDLIRRWKELSLHGCAVE